jgi:hypothetical protein
MKAFAGFADIVSGRVSSATFSCLFSTLVGTKSIRLLMAARSIDAQTSMVIFNTCPSV